MTKVRVTDARMPPFCWQDKAAIRLIRKSFKASEVATALAVYLTLSELASNNHSDEFKVKRATIGEWVGRSSVRSVDKYLESLANLGLIEKRPHTVDNEHRCMIIRLLPTPTAGNRGQSETEADTTVQPTAGVVQPTAPPPKAQSTAQGGAAHDVTPGSPLPIESEESISKKNRSFKNAGPEAPQSDGGQGSQDPPLAERGGGAAAGGGGAGRLHSASGGSGLILPGEEADESPRNGRSKSKRKRDPLGVPPAEWRPYDAANYFQQRFKQKWSGQFMVEAGAKEGGQLKGLLAKLDADGFGRGLMAQVIDHIFDHWDRGLPGRLNWSADYPNLSLICSPRWFETLAREVQNGVPKPKGKLSGGRQHDEYDPSSAKRAKDSADGWGD